MREFGEEIDKNHSLVYQDGIPCIEKNGEIIYRGDQALSLMEDKGRAHIDKNHSYGFKDGVCKFYKHG